MADQDQPENGERSLSKIVNLLAYLVEKLDPGEVAALRRGIAAPAESPTFWELYVRHVQPDQPRGANVAHEDAWGVLLGIMAHLQGQHQPRRALGEALAAADISEPRLFKLLRSTGSTFEDALRSVVHRLATSGEAVDFVEIARLLFARGPEATRARRSVARAYYTHLTHKSQLGTQAAPSMEATT